MILCIQKDSHWYLSLSQRIQLFTCTTRPVTVNMESKYSQPPVLPRTILRRITPNITLLQPLSRRGCGPGLVILVSESGAVDDASATRIENGIPCPLMKWAEESYTVVEITQEALFRESDPLKLALTELAACKTTEPKSAVGIISTESPVNQHNFTLE